LYIEIAISDVATSTPIKARTVFAAVAVNNVIRLQLLLWEPQWRSDVRINILFNVHTLLTTKIVGITAINVSISVLVNAGAVITKA